MNSRIMLAVVALIAMPLQAAEPLVIQVSRHHKFAPATLYVQAVVERDRRNRGLQVLVESEDFYRSSYESLDGDRAPRTRRMEFRDLPAGRYEARAILVDEHARPLAMVAQLVEIVPKG